MSIISQTAFEAIRANPDPSAPTVNLRMANGSVSSPQTQTTTSINIGSDSYPVTLLIVDGFPFEVLLGLDFLQDYNAVLNFGEGEAWIGETCIKIPSRSDPNRNFLRSEKRLRIAANSECVVNLVCHRRASGSFIVESNRIAEERGLVVAATLSTAKGSRILARIANPTNEDIIIPKGLPIATGEKIESDPEQSESQRTAADLLATTAADASDLPSWSSFDINPNLSDPQRAEITRLLKRYADIISKNEMDTGLTDLTEHVIETGRSAPIRQRPYRISFAEREKVRDLVNDLIRSGKIQESTSPWACPIVLVKKKDGSLRFCCDWRKLNQVTRKDAMPLPLIPDMIDRLAQAKFFTKLDFTSGFYQVRLSEPSREKTAFVTPDGHYEWNVMGMGLTNAPATFQRLMHKMLGSLLWQHSMAYMDDLIVYSATFEDHLRNLTEVFEAIRSANLKVKPTKCEFAKQSIPYLGHIISSDGVRCDPANIEKIRNFPLPQSRKDVRCFLGLTSYYRRFIEKYSFIAKPLHDLTKESVQFGWEPIHTEAFESLRRKLISPPILAFPDFTKPFRVSTDASGVGIGSVLKQGDPGHENVIAYASRVLRPEEQRYSATEREFLALRYATQVFRPYLYGTKFVVVTDHQSLRHLRTMKTPNGRIQRWNMDLLDFDFEVVYKPGKTNTDADTMSRYGMETGE